MPKNDIRSSYVGLCGTRVTGPLRPCNTSAALCRIGHRMRNELLLTHEKRMMLTKEKSNTHRQRKLPYDERPVKGSRHFRQISTDAKKMTFVRHT